MKHYIHQSSNRTVHIVTLYKYSQIAFYIRFMILKNIAEFEKVQIEHRIPI
jgi:hypothetical protein